MRKLLRRWLQILDGIARRWYPLRMRIEGVKLGKHALVRGRVVTGNPERISIGEHAVIGSGVLLKAAETAKITIGDHVLINEYTIINSGVEVVLDDWVTIAPHCQIVDANHGFSDPSRPIRQQDENYQMSPVCLGRDVWLGCHVVVLKGISIGAGAGSVVTRDIPERAIAVGVPARVVGWRGDAPAEQIADSLRVSA